MGQIYCLRKHKTNQVAPVMICFGDNSLGRQYICAVCSDVRVFNKARVIYLNDEKKFGFIKGIKNNIYFRFSNRAYDFKLFKGILLSYEVEFLSGDNNQSEHAINIKPLEA